MTSRDDQPRINLLGSDVQSRSARSRVGAASDPPAQGTGLRHLRMAADPATGSVERGKVMTRNRRSLHSLIQIGSLEEAV
jgi:hypothetical protein